MTKQSIDPIIEEIHETRREIAKRIVGRFEEQRIEDQPGRGGEDQRVAIRVGLGHDLMRNHAARAGAIVDDHLLAPVIGEALCDGARREIIGAACGAGDDDAYGPHRVVGAGLSV